MSDAAFSQGRSGTGFGIFLLCRGVILTRDAVNDYLFYRGAHFGPVKGFSGSLLTLYKSRVPCFNSSMASLMDRVLQFSLLRISHYPKLQTHYKCSSVAGCCVVPAAFWVATWLE